MFRRMVGSALLFLTLTLLAAPGQAAARPWIRPAAEPPAPPAVALLTLTTMPRGWEARTDLRPVLQVFADGRALELPDAVAPERDPGTAPHQRTGRIPAEVLSAALAEIQALATADFGVPTATGQGRRIIDLAPPPPQPSAHLIVYAPGVTGGLSPAQQAARTRFAAVYDTLLDSFVPDR